MSSNTCFSGATDDTVTFSRPIGHLNISVAAGAAFSFSIDLGVTFITLPAGFHSFPVRPVTEVQVKSSGAWQLIGVQF